MIGLDDPWENSTALGKDLLINFVLCDIVIDNVFAGIAKQEKSLEDHKKITIYLNL